MTVTSLSTLSVVSDTDNYIYTNYLSVGDATYGNFGVITIHPAAGDDAEVTYDPYDYLATIKARDNTPPLDDSIKAGTHFSTPITYTGTSPSETLQIDLLDDALNVIDSVRVIPEPVTMSLLALGGLVMLRKRRP
jgi:hypothetical protein